MLLYYFLKRPNQHLDAVSKLKLIVAFEPAWSVVKFPPPVRNGLNEEIVIVASFAGSMVELKVMFHLQTDL
jgi:hypothetical protein